MRASVVVPAVLVIALGMLPLIVPTFYVYVAALILVTALLAMSLNIALGYGGIYQFHHGVFYGVGAYALAIAVTKGGWSPWIGFVVGPCAAAAAGLLIGWFCVRLTRLYFGMLQISLGSLLWTIVLRWYPVTGGDNGIHDIAMPAALRAVNGAYYFVLAIVALAVGALYVIVKSPFGVTLQAVRDNPQRCQSVGVDVRKHQLIAVVIAAFFAGVAGVLYVALERSVFSNMLFWVLSLEVFVMCLLGGWYTFAGPMVGAGVMVALRTVAGRYTENWTMVIGIMLVLLILFMPEGVLGFALRRLRPAPAAEG